jgi:hypothetical protein
MLELKLPSDGTRKTVTLFYTSNFQTLLYIKLKPYVTGKISTLCYTKIARLYRT